ncbi:uncharacterized protein LOC111268380 isoform X2 [Varroa jacobsoni]|uniref:Uncharacterized protein n=1 Tax=Varroa destructor TaxID=109461 RepID=A0A7M7KBR3_VARDE|nr:uncharacterized protein LOC111251246 isoform X2 [Varroa destructor]XP_022703093.1 uncharacterized protein LOC111268380 isoform X2 [Varroa jacobsoni]
MSGCREIMELQLKAATIESQNMPAFNAQVYEDSEPKCSFPHLKDSKLEFYFPEKAVSLQFDTSSCILGTPGHPVLCQFRELPNVNSRQDETSNKGPVVSSVGTYSLGSSRSMY